MNLIVALVIASLVYIVQKRLYAKWWNRNLDVTISFEDTCVREGDASALTESARPTVIYLLSLVMPIRAPDVCAVHRISVRMSLQNP